jgi:UDP-N-acetylmuramoyl-L-alanyl-D-glutamate--2,6-diaminopimelate ligase
MSARRLGALLEGIDTVPAAGPVADVVVEDLASDSREVRRGGLFLACRGRRTHGLAHLSEALTRGARVVLWERGEGDEPPALPAGAPAPVALAVPALSRHAGTIADRFFGRPSATLAVAGITGTNGKTTSAWLLAQALTATGRPCGYVGTLGAGLPPSVLPGSHTTADAVTVHRQLASLRAGGATAVAMEVSSHALDQDRVGGVRFRVAAFTNLTRDHLDYHGTMEAYGAAKARLFAWPGLDARVFNVDDAFGAALAGRERDAGRPVCVARAAHRIARARALAAAEGAGFVLAGEAVRASASGLTLAVETHAGDATLQLPLMGEFNADNAMLVLAMLLELGVPLADACVALGSGHAPPGRMEAIRAPAGAAGRPLAIVDYAHTPDALAKALAAARAHCRGRLTAVFGCGGDRDRGKRPQMGRIAGELADRVLVTDDNPRSEAPELIAAEVLAGVPPGALARVVHDRGAAIRAALDEAGDGDVVLIAGKGHEDYQLVGDRRLSFSDREAARAALAAGSAAAANRGPGASP